MWNRLPADIVAANAVAAFKRSLGGNWATILSCLLEGSTLITLPLKQMNRRQSFVTARFDIHFAFVKYQHILF